MSVKGKRIGLLAVGAIFLIGLVLAAVPPQKVSAAQFTSRSLTLIANGANGGSAPNVSVHHAFSFTTPTGATNSIGSIQFLYCTTASGTCTTPTGLNTSSATLFSQSGTGGTGFTINTGTAGAPYITRSAANIGPSVDLDYQLNTITNPTAANTTFYVRISSFTSTNVSGSPIDTGVVAASTADPVILSGTMPESLIFCTGWAVNVTCTSTASAATIHFDDLFSPSATRFAKAEMAASTNAGGGYAITMFGATMTSGGNTITAMSSATTSVIGTSQFGTNLMANTAAASFTSGNAPTWTNTNGTVTNTAGSPTITGTNTTFLITVSVGDLINFTSGTLETCTVQTVNSNTSITCAANITNAHTNATYSITESTGASFGATVSPATNAGTQHKGQPSTDYNTAETYKFASGNTVAASDASGAGPSNSQKYTMSYIVNVNPAQPAGAYQTTLTYICTATF
jgi:hypothetical protein